MKKINNSESFYLNNCKFYRDDIQSIYAIIFGTSETSIYSGDYAYNDLDELFTEKQKSRSIQHLKFMCKGQPYLSFEVTTDQVRLYIDSEDEKAYASYFRIKELIAKCVRTPNWLYKPLVSFAMNLCLSLYLYFFDTSIDIYLRIALTFLSVATAAWTMYLVTLHRACVIASTDRGEDVGLFRTENREKIFVTLFCAAVIALVSFFCGRLFPSTGQQLPPPLTKSPGIQPPRPAISAPNKN